MRLISFVLSLLGCALMIGPTLLTSIREVAAGHDSATTLAKLTSLFSSLFLFWVIAAGVFNFHFSWQVDMPRAFRLPVKPLRMYAVRLGFCLTGPWLVLLFPVWLWLAWRQSVRVTDFLLLIIGILMFVVLINITAGIVGFITGKVTSGWFYTIVIFVAFAVLNVFIFASIRAVMMKDSSVLTRFSQALSSVSKFRVWDVLPGAIVANAYQAAAQRNIAALLLCLLALMVVIALAASLEFFLIKRTFLQGRPLSAGRGSGGRSLLLSGLLMFGDRPGVPLLLKELRSLLSLKVIRMLLFFFGSYLPLFVVFVPPAGLHFTLVICTFPVMIFSSVKGNLLGPECGSLKSLFSIPIQLSEVLKAKSLALNLLVTSIIGEAFLAGFIAGTIPLSALQLSIIIFYCIALLSIWDILGSYCSIRFPSAMLSQGPSQNDAFNPSGFIMVFGAPLVLVPFATVQTVCLQAGRPLLSLLGCGALAVIAFGANRLIYWPWFEQRLAIRRDEIYSSLLYAAQ